MKLIIAYIIYANQKNYKLLIRFIVNFKLIFLFHNICVFL